MSASGPPCACYISHLRPLLARTRRTVLCHWDVRSSWRPVACKSCIAVRLLPFVPFVRILYALYTPFIRTVRIADWCPSRAGATASRTDTDKYPASGCTTDATQAGPNVTSQHAKRFKSRGSVLPSGVCLQHLAVLGCVVLYGPSGPAQARERNVLLAVL